MEYIHDEKLIEELDLLKIFAEAEDDVNNGRIASMQETFNDIRENLLAKNIM